MGNHVPNMIDHSEVLTNHNPNLQHSCSRLETQHAWSILCSMLDTLESFKVSLHYITLHAYRSLFQYHISNQKYNIRHNMKLGTWSKGHQGLNNNALHKGFNKYTAKGNIKIKTKNTLYIQTDKHTQECTRHGTKWNQLYWDSNTDFSWFRKCLVV